MSPRSHFVQGCPVCGRPLEIQCAYSGRRVACAHCGGQFLACDPAAGQPATSEWSRSLLGRAERLLDLASRRLATA